jgi:hypothetical protein
MICAPAVERQPERSGAETQARAGEDGADDHIRDKPARSLCGKTGRAQSPSGKALANGGATFSANLEMFREKF